MGVATRSARLLKGRARPRRIGTGIVAGALLSICLLSGDAGAGTAAGGQTGRPLLFTDAPVPITLACPDGDAMLVTPTGTGTFAPAREMDGDRVFIPIEFVGGSATYVYDSGQVAVGDYFGSYTKGAAKSSKGRVVTCGFGWTVPFDGGTARFGGRVTGQLQNT